MSSGLDEEWAILQAYDHKVGEWLQASEWLKEMMKGLEESHPEVIEQREEVKGLDEALSEMVRDNPWLVIASSDCSEVDDSPSIRHDDEVRNITLFGDVGE